MRYIFKGPEPKIFTDWKNLANEDWQPSYKLLSNPEKKAVFRSLIQEQGGICCYCERKLEPNDYHIEHLNPQAEHNDDDLDYENLLCSCLRKTAKGAPLHCGKTKEDYELKVTPLDPNCQQQFNFSSDGSITALTQEAKEAIEILKLDLEKLCDMRAKMFEPFLDPELEQEEFLAFIRGYVKKDSNGFYNPFVSAVESEFSEFL
ncbi:TIGR02646 family protein (plasmid) [Photobacterium damselae]|uniref:retron system putative HNH endonuclease n=1 Tax=Photobacterium damselae TaxID=38293 RepID=UPI003C6DC27C